MTPEERRRILGLEPDENAPSSMSETQRRSILGLDPRAPSEPGAPAPLSDDERRSILGLDALAAPAAPAPPSAPVQRFSNPPPAPPPERARGTGMDALHDIGAGLAGIIPTAESTVRGTIQSNRHLGLYDRDERMETLKERIAGPRPEEDKLYFKMGDLELGSREIQQGLSNLGFSLPSQVAGLGASAITQRLTGNPKASAKAGTITSAAMGGLTGYRTQFNDFMVMARDAYLNVHPLSTGAEWEDYRERVVIPAARRYGFHEAAWEAVGEGVGRALPGAKIPLTAPLRNAILQKLANGSIKTLADLTVELGGETITQVGQNRALADIGLVDQKPEWTDPQAWRRAFVEVGPTVAIMSGAHMATGAAMQGAYDARARARAERAALPPARSTARDAASTPLSEPMSARNATVRAEDIRIHEPPRAMEASPEAAPAGVDQERELALAQTVGRELAGSDEATLEARDLAYAAMAQGRYGDVDAALGFWRAGQRDSARQALLGPTPDPAVERPSLGPTQPDSIQPFDHTTSNPKGGDEHGVQEGRQGQGTVESSEPPAAIPPAVPTEPPAALPPPRALPEAYRDSDGVWYTRETDGAWTMLDNPARLATEDRARALETRYQQEQAARAQREAKAATPPPPSPPEPPDAGDPAPPPPSPPPEAPESPAPPAFTPDERAANPYLVMPIERVMRDAEHGVALAREALNRRQSESPKSARAAAPVVPPPPPTPAPAAPSPPPPPKKPIPPRSPPSGMSALRRAPWHTMLLVETDEGGQRTALQWLDEEPQTLKPGQSVETYDPDPRRISYQSANPEAGRAEQAPGLDAFVDTIRRKAGYQFMLAEQTPEGWRMLGWARKPAGRLQENQYLIHFWDKTPGARISAYGDVDADTMPYLSFVLENGGLLHPDKIFNPLHGGLIDRPAGQRAGGEYDSVRALEEYINNLSGTKRNSPWARELLGGTLAPDLMAQMMSDPQEGFTGAPLDPTGDLVEQMSEGLRRDIDRYVQRREDIRAGRLQRGARRTDDDVIRDQENAWAQQQFEEDAQKAMGAFSARTDFGDDIAGQGHKTLSQIAVFLQAEQAAGRMDAARAADEWTRAYAQIQEKIEQHTASQKTPPIVHPAATLDDEDPWAETGGDGLPFARRPQPSGAMLDFGVSELPLFTHLSVPASDRTTAEAQATVDTAQAEAQADRDAQAEAEAEAFALEADIQDATRAEGPVADAGAKIGGARKDQAPVRRRPRAATEEEADALLPAWRRRFEIAQDAINHRFFLIEKAKRGTPQGRMMRSFGMNGRILSGFDYATRAEAEAALPVAAASVDHRIRSYQDEQNRERFAILRVLSNGNMPPVKTGFATRDEAITYMVRNAAEILEYRFEMPKRPYLSEIQRTGPDRRGGRDVSAQSFVDTFGFRAAEFGNWNLGQDGQASLNHAYDALMDLADALGVPPRALSLHGELAVAFGARGKGGLNGSSAHYEPDYGVINLTKPRGAGALAHEWFHALDAYFYRRGQSPEPVRLGDYQTFGVQQRGLLSAQASAPTTALRPELVGAYRELLKAMQREDVPMDASDLDLAQRAVESTRREIERIVEGLARNMQTYNATGYMRRARAPTETELSTFRQLGETLKNPDGLGERVSVEPTGINPQTQRMRYFSATFSSWPALRAMNDIYKSVTGRSFDTADPYSEGRRLDGYIWHLEKNLAEAWHIQNGKSAAKIQPTQYLRNAKDADRYRSSAYWALAHEMAARAFEQFAEDRMRSRGQRSPYLVHSTDNRFYGDMKIYPEGTDRANLARHFARFFDTLLLNRERAGGVELYRTPSPGAVLAQSPRADRVELRALARRMLGEGVQLEFVERLLAGGLDRLGSYRARLMRIVDGKGTPRNTLLHEAVHAAEALLLTPGERARLDAFQPDAEARAEGFVSYAARRRGIAGKMRAIWDVLIARLRALFGRNNGADAFRDFYGRLLMGYYARRGELGTPTPTEIAYRTPASVREGEATRSEAERAAPADGGAAALEALRQLDFLTALYAPPKAKALPARPPDAIRIYPRAMPEPADAPVPEPSATYPAPTPGNRTALPPPRDTALAQAANAKAFTDQSTAEDWNRAFQEGQGGAYAFMLEKLEDRTSEHAYMQSLMGLKINTALDYAAVLLPLRRPDIERVMVGVLDDQDRIACVECVTVGILDASMFERLEIFNVAVRAMDRGVKVSGIIVSHNHPSGDPTPSIEDILVTRKLRNAGKVIGIPLRYHIITNGKTFSYSLPAAKGFSDGDEVVFDVATFDPTHRAEWENRPSVELPKIWGPMSFAKVAQLMAGGAGPNRAHVIVVNTKQRIVAAFRLEIPREPDGSVRHDDLARACVQLAITQPARGIFFDSDMSAADTLKMILRLRAHANTMGLDLFDAAMGGIPQNPNNGIKEWNVPLDRITREAPAGYAGAPVFYANARAALDETRDAPAFLQARRMIRALPDIVGAPLENELRARINEERSQINNLILGLPRHDQPDMFGGTSAYQNAMAQAAARMESWRKDVERLADYEARQGDLFGGMRFMAGAAAPAPFYSMLARAVEGMKQAAAGKAMAMPGDQMLNRIRALPGVKKQEIEESGLADWLRMQKEQGLNVTRDDVRAFLEQHGVQIVPVHKGARPGVLEWDGDELMLNGTAVAFISDDGLRGWSVYDSYVGRAEEGRIVSGLMTRAQAEQAAEVFAREGNQNFTDASTKYSGYAPPGGISGTYREVLLKVPESVGLEAKTWEQFKEESDRLGVPEERARSNYERYRQNVKATTAAGGRQFIGPHWSEANVIAHMLMDERRIPLDALQKSMPELAARLRAEGQTEARALYMIEGQSDLHAAGQAKGYQSNDEMLLRALFKEKDAILERAQVQTTMGVTSLTIQPYDLPRYDELNSQIEQIQSGNPDIGYGRVPALPMRGDAWKRLILRTMLREAATGGFDLLTWSTGENRFQKWGSQRVEWKQQKSSDNRVVFRDDRWAIVGKGGKGVAADGKFLKFKTKEEAVAFKNTLQDAWTVAAVEQSGGEHAGMNIEQAARERGQLLETKGQTVRTKDDLRRVIESIKRGDETNVDKLTERIWSRMQTEPEGTSLPRKEFFEFLYDQSLVSQANDILRTMDQGNRVEGAAIGVGRWRVEGIYDPSVSFDARAKAEEYAQTVGIPLDRVYQEGDPAGVHAIAITDAIRSGVTAGQPYYQAGAARDAGGMSADQVRQSLGRAADGVDIFDSLADLERAEPQTAARLRQAARMAGVRADTAPGVYTGDGRIIFFARNLMGADHAAEALFHEYTERGLDALRRASPDQMSAFLGDIYEGRLDQMEDYRRAAGVVRSRYGYDENTPEGRVEFAREVLAHIAQTRTERPDLWERAVAALRRFLARLFQGTPLEARFAEAPHAVLGRMLDATIAIGARANETERLALARGAGMETIRQTRSALPPARGAGMETIRQTRSALPPARGARGMTAPTRPALPGFSPEESDAVERMAAFMTAWHGTPHVRKKAADMTPEEARAAGNTAELDNEHRLKKPIKGKTGAEIVGYQWVSTVEDGMYGDRRVSDWSGAQTSVPTGRQIVHLFWVRTPDGQETLMGVGAAKKALGYNEQRLYSIAKQEQLAQREWKRRWDSESDRIEKEGADTTADANRQYRKANNPANMMWGTLEQHMAAAEDSFNKARLLTKNGKWIRTGSEETISELTARGWTDQPPAPAPKGEKSASAHSEQWFRGERQDNASGDRFFSMSEDVAGDYGAVRKASATEMPRNPLSVQDKPTLAEQIGYKGDPLAEPTATPTADKFDTMAKQYARQRGHDGIRYDNGTFGEPELHVFNDAQPAPTPAPAPKGEKAVVERFNPASSDIRFMAGALDRARDAQYSELERRAKAGDQQAKAEAQRMVDEAAKAAGKENILYRGAKTKDGLSGKWWTPSKRYAAHYSHGSGLVTRGAVGDLKLLSLDTKRDADLWREITKTGKSESEKRRMIVDAGYDGTSHFRGSEVNIYNESKLPDNADAFTYRDDGTLIPLSERFNPASSDIRFMAGALDRAADSKPDAWMPATGDVVRGDTIRFTEAVFAGSFRNPQFSGNREIVAEVLNDSYGRDKQQHTFTLRVIRSSGTQPLEAGVTTTRKGRNVYRNGTERLEWTDENARTMAASEKHTRGDAARRSRDVRRMADGAAFMAAEGGAAKQPPAHAPSEKAAEMTPGTSGETYHRYTKSPSGFSDVPWMMFSKQEDDVSLAYGPHHFIADDSNAVDASDLKGDIASALENHPDLVESLQSDPATLASESSPERIVDTAGLWDNADIVQVIWDDVLEPKGITKVRTPDGLIVFDPADMRKASRPGAPNAASDIRFMAGDGAYGRGSPAVAWRDDTPNVLILRTARAMELRPEYKTAKAGDAEAARAVAQWALAGDTEALGALAQAHPQARVVPVHGEAGNAIPAALARAIHGRYGLAVEDGIRKQPDSDAARRTGKDAWHRMVYRPRFDGPVTAGAEYILVDDVSTMGGTFSELRQHIERNGGRVVGMVAAATGKMGAKVALDPATRTALDMQFGREALSGWMREHGLYGGEVAALTEAEARALMREKSLADASVRHLKAQRAAERAGVPEVESAPEDLGSAMNLIRHKERAIRRLMEQHEDIHALQRNLHDLMRISRIPMEKRGRVISDIVRLSRPKSKDALFRYYQQAVEKLNRLDSWYAGDNLRQQAWEILRAETPKLSRKYPTGTRTPDTYREMARIRRIAGLTESERNARLKALADAVEARGEGAQMSPEEAHEQYLVDTFGALNDMGEDKARRAVNDLETLVKNGAFEHQASERERMARMEELRAMAQGVIRGGAYPMSQADRQRAKADAKGILDAIGNYMALQDSWETLLDNLSKFDRESSPLQSGLSYFTRLVHRATHDSETGLESQMRIITSNAARIFGVPEKKLGTVAAENGRVLKDTGVHFSYDREAGRQMPLSKNQAYKLWQLYLDPTLEHALDANGMDDRMRQELEAFIGPKVMEWARWQVDEFYPAYYQRINRVYRDMFHVDLPYHEGYSPAFREFSSAREDAKDLLGDESRQSTVMNGSLYSRIENERPFKLVDGDTVLFSHIGSMEHFINWADPVRTLRSTLGHESVQNAITERHGRDKAKIMNGFIKRFATGGDDRRVVYGLFERIRSNFSAAVIASPVTGLKQLSSFPAYMAEIPVMDFLGGVAEALSNPGKALRELSTSKMMQSRYRQGWERDVRLDMRRGKTAAPLSPRSLKSASRIFTELGDKASVVIGGYGVYRYHMKKALAEGRSEADARRIGLEEFELATERSQQAGGVKDLSELQSNPTTRMFTMFQTSPFSFMRMTRMALRNLYYGRGKRSDHIKRLAVFNFIIPMLFTWIAQGFRWRDDEEDQDKPTAIPGLPRAYARNVASAPFQGLFVAGPVVESMVSAYQQERVYSDIANKLVPFVRPADDIVRIAREIGDMVENDRITTDDVMDILGEAGEAGGMFLGIPTGPAMRSIGGVSAAVRGETPYPLRRTLGYSPTMMGEKKPRRSSKTLAGMGPALYTPVLPKPEMPKLLVPKLD